ncbi:MAG: hypothetical protein AAF267_25115 [Deinococcota bacterium]
MKLRVLSLVLFCLLSHATAQDTAPDTAQNPVQDTQQNTAQEERPRNWAAFSVGLPTIDAQIGFYDPFGLWANPRLVVGYVISGGAFVNLDSLWFVRGRSGFYLGAGSGLLTSGDYTVAGLHLTSGTDIVINDSSGILLDSAIGVYPLVLRDNSDENGGTLGPFFGRVTVGYRISF